MPDFRSLLHPETRPLAVGIVLAAVAWILGGIYFEVWR